MVFAMYFLKFLFNPIYLRLKSGEICQKLTNLIVNYKIFVFKFGGFVFSF